MSRTDPLISEELGDYKIISVLGRGGMARVYRGFDPKLERFAAVKVIDKGLAQPEYRERFQREARAIAKLQHPRIVHVFQFGETEDYFYMAMVFVEGRDLAHLIREARSMDQLLPVPRAMRIIRDVAEALDYAHSQGVIHRDVKPSNVMVTPEGRGVLTDFGLALSVTEGTIGSTFGTAHYIAPEQAVSSANAVPQSDQYSLGVVAYQLLTGRVPFDDPGITNIVLKHLNTTPAQPSSVNPKLPSNFDAALMRALEKTPDARYSTCIGLVRGLEEAFDQVERQQAEEAFLNDWDSPPPVPPGIHIDTAVDRPTTLAMPVTTEAETGRAAFDLDAPDVLPMDDTPMVTPIPVLKGNPQPSKRATSEVRATGEARAAKRKTSEAAASEPPAGISSLSRPSSMRRTTGSFAAVMSDAPADKSTSTRSEPRTEAARRISPVLLALIAVVILVIVGSVIVASGVLNGANTAGTPTSVAAAGNDTTPPLGVDGSTRPPTFTPTPSVESVVAAGATVHETAEVTAENTETTADITLEATSPTATRRTRVLTLINAEALGGASSATPTPTRTPRSTSITRTSAPRATIQGTRTTATQPANASTTPTDTLTRPSTGTPNDRATDALTPTDDVVPTVAATRIPTVVRADVTAVASDPTIDENKVILVYNGNTFVLYNRTGAPLNVSRWLFVQVDAEIAGEAVAYQASQWAGTGARLDRLATIECLQLWRITLGNQPIPDDCPERAAWRSVGQRRWFWISDAVDGTFQIRDGQGFTARVLTTCPTARTGDDETQVRCELVMASGS